MVFNSYSFLLFFPVVLILVNILPVKWRNGLLLLSSYLFYASWGKRYCVLLLFVTGVVYGAGLLLEKKHQKGVFLLGLLGALGGLLLYKYANFVLSTGNTLLQTLGLGQPLPVLCLAMPAGISFFTFQAAGYLIDVYQGKYPAERSFLRLALFVSFFPQILSGPIGRGDQLLPQYAHPKKPTYDQLRHGLLVMTWGFFLKLMLADRAAILVNTVYGAYKDYAGICLVFATLVYALQIYCDFAGYSYMAIGGAGMLGIELPKNFDTPYFAQSVQEFWRRWHISLSTWFRDYVYFPLGGSRCSKIKKYRNIFIVFLVSGLWHGAMWSFVLWGAIHALYQILGALTKPARERALNALHVNRDSGSYRVFRMLCTFLLVDFAWLFFRAEGLGNAFAMLRWMFTELRPTELVGEAFYTMGLDRPDFWAMLVFTGVLVLVDVLRYRGVNLWGWYQKQNWLFRELGLAAVMLLIVTYGVWGNGFDASSFIYFKF